MGRNGGTTPKWVQPSGLLLAEFHFMLSAMIFLEFNFNDCILSVDFIFIQWL